MDSYVVVIAFVTLSFQICFSWIVGYGKQKANKEITEYIRSLYKWLPKVTGIMYVVAIAKKFLGLPIEISFLGAAPVLVITIFTTALLSFYPLKLINNLVRNLRLTA